MEFTSFDQMNQMIAAASGMLSQTLLWVLSGLVLGLSLCSVGGSLLLSFKDTRQAQSLRQPSLAPAPSSDVVANSFALASLGSK